jgi:Cu(I)/Ag(I) efflux system membrane fusion protein
MSLLIKLARLSSALLFLALIVGCGKKEEPKAMEPASDAQAATAPSADEQATIDAELAKLTPDDLKLAEAQAKLCPVSDHALGSMGAPVKVKDVNGRDVFICCEGCEEELRKNADKYLAKIKTE